MIGEERKAGWEGGGLPLTRRRRPAIPIAFVIENVCQVSASGGDAVLTMPGHRGRLTSRQQPTVMLSYLSKLLAP
jgi:hypothetical protein